ncbi:MAG: hypothetical protein ABIP75_11855 [Pyrinomonadaceae bacterium]
MTLPTRFSNVTYYLISGEYSFAGELVLSKQTLYFFPFEDLVGQRMDETFDDPQSLKGEVKWLFKTFKGLVRGTPFERMGIWHKGISDEQFRTRADACIAGETTEASLAVSRASLPSPSRFLLGEMSNLGVSAQGGLSFATQSDQHDFLVGWWGRKKLRAALQEAGFGEH